MGVRIIRTDDPGLWDSEVDRFRTDTYFLSGYHKAYETEHEKAELFLYESAGDRLAYPFLRRPIAEVSGQPVTGTYCDIETVYGYTGPVSTSTDKRFLAEAWQQFSVYCLETGVVAEFARFDPFLRNWQVAPADMQIVDDRETVAVSLTFDPDALWASYPSIQRNRLRKAQAAGLVCEKVDNTVGIETFVTLYYHTMDRLGAADSYWFGARYFDILREELGARLECYLVRDGDQIVAGGLFFRDDKTIHYHLGGSDADALAKAPNNLLFHTVALQNLGTGPEWLHLGGGRTPKADDNLFRFKKTFSGERKLFKTGRKIHDQGAYGTLCDLWKSRNPAVDAPPYFLLYRQ